MRRLAMALLLVAAAHSATHADESAKRLVEVLPPTSFSTGHRTLTINPPATSGHWFLTVKRSRRTLPVRIKVNGKSVMRTRDAVRAPQEAIYQVEVGSVTQIRVRVYGSGSTTLALQGVVPESDLASPPPGRRVARQKLLDQRLTVHGGWFPRLVQADFPVSTGGGTEGLFALTVTNGPRRVFLGSARWNSRWLVDPLALNYRTRSVSAPVDLASSNQLRVVALGVGGSSLRVRVRGFLVDEVAPTLGISSPAPGSTPDPNTPVAIAFADAGSGIASGTLRVLVNGTDVTGAFTIGENSATTTIGNLPPGSVVPGTNTIVASIRDRACNTREVTRSFQQGGGLEIRHPDDVVVECRGPAGTAVAFTATTEPGATVTCSPASGSVFPLGTTTVTCTATQGATSSISTFDVIVRDSAPPILGQGDLAFVDSRASSTATQDVALADLDGDGNLDLLGTTPTGLEVRSGDGAGRFGTPQVISLGSRTAIEVGNLTGDDRPEVLLLDSAGGQIQILLNDGAGNLSLGGSLVTGPSPSAMVLTDLDGDGGLDLAVAHADQSLRLYKGSGPAFAAVGQLATGSTPSAVRAVDLDRDGEVDLLVCDQGDNTLSLFRGSGSAFGFEPRATVATDSSPVDMAVHDFDGDGWLDVVTANQGSTTLSLFRGAGSGLGTPEVVVAGGSPQAIQTADLNGDGDPDLVVALGSHVGLYLGGAGATFEPPVLVECSSSSTVVGDTNGDGRPDAACSSATGLVTLASDPGVVIAPTEAQQPGGALVSFSIPVVDACGVPTIACNPASGDLFGLGTTTVTCTASDSAGNTSRVSFAVLVEDTTPPDLAQPQDLTVEATGPSGAQVSYAEPSATDLVDPAPVVACAPSSGTQFSLGSTIVTCTATDTQGNTTQTSFTVTVEDTTPPALSQPPSFSVEQQTPAGAVVSFQLPQASDFVDPAPSVVCTPASGSTFPPGPTVVTCTATDAAGNASQVSFTVSVADTTPPVISSLPDLVLEQTSAQGAVAVFPTPQAADSVDPSVSVICEPASGQTFAPGSTTVTCTGTDASGNQAQTTFLVTVQDTTEPSLSLSPSPGSTQKRASVALVASFVDVAGVTEFRAFLDGQEITSSFGFQPGDSTVGTTTSPLLDGSHVFSVTVADLAGNSTTATSAFQVAAEATRFELSISPGDPTDLGILSENDLTIRALSSDGTPATTFEGLVLLSASDSLPPLQGTVADFLGTGGTAVLPGVLIPRSVGALLVTAAAIPDSPGGFAATGSLALTVSVTEPLVFPPPPTAPPSGVFDLEGFSFAGQSVRLLVDGQVVDTQIASSGGAYAFSLSLGPGQHSVVVEGSDPDAGGAFVPSLAYTIEVPQPVALSIELAPNALSISVGQAQLLEVTTTFADGTTTTSTDSIGFQSSTSAVATISSEGVLAAVAPGQATITATRGTLVATSDVTVGIASLIDTSPGHGESGVAITRESILRFSAPVASVSSGAVTASLGGESLAFRSHLAPNGTTLTLFYSSPLPAAARVRLTVDGTGFQMAGGGTLDATGDGLPGGVRTIDFDTLDLALLPGTAVCGRVFASELAPVGTGSINTPLAGVRISIDGLEDTAFTTTDENGNFRLEPVPSGSFFVHIDGRQATNSIPAGAYYPFVGKSWTAQPNRENNVGDVFLPLVQAGSLQPASATTETVAEFAPTVLAQRPELAGARITVPADSLYADDGARGGQVGIAPVPPDRLPGTLPPALNPPLVITVQTDGPTNFDRPVSLRLPNLEGAAPGTPFTLWSFNHDTGAFEASGAGVVSADGFYIETTAGTGIQAPGWHMFAQGAQGFGGRGVLGKDPCAGFDTDCFPLAEGQECPPGYVMKSGRGGKLKLCVCVTTGSVILSSGEEVVDRVDLAIRGRGAMHFQLARRYRSKFDYDGPLGHNWVHDYLTRLEVGPGGESVRLLMPGSNVVTFTLQAGSYVSPKGLFSVLRREADGTFTIVEPDGTRLCFSETGLLECMEDRWGNTLQFRHDEEGNLVEVVDPYGRSIDFFYSELAGAWRLVQVTDFIGRSVKYSYDEEGDLVSVTSPAVTGTSTGNDFPEGRTERYAYSSGFAEPELNHNIIAITAPQEVADGGPPRFTWTYGTNPADPDTFDRVLTETEGGVNSSGISAGGTRTFDYLLIDPTPATLDLPKARARVTDRNGNVSDYFVNSRDHHILHRVYTRGLRPGEPAFFETRSFFNEDGELTRRIFPEGNEVRFQYATGPRRSQGNVVEIRRIAGPRGGGDDLVTTLTYEPLFNQVLTKTDPRGNAAGFTPPLGTASAERYTLRKFYDYMEHTDPVPLAVELGISLASVQRGLGDLNGDGRTDQSFGNQIRAEAPTVNLRADSAEAALLGSTQQHVVFESRWNDRGQVVERVDPEGNVTTLAYYPSTDPDGDGHAVNQLWVSHPVGEEAGYLRSSTLDSSVSPRRRSTVPPTALLSAYGYDPVGNMIRMVDRRGVVQLREVNQLNEVVSVTRGADVSQAVALGELPLGTQPLGYKTRTTYDFNGRIVKLEVENRDGNALVGRYAEETFTYDILDNEITAVAEVSESGPSGPVLLTTTNTYDANENLVQVQMPEGNSTRTDYDERDLVFRVTRGFGTASAATAQIDYDKNGNHTVVTDAEDTDGDGSAETTVTSYDGFDRVVRITDALGNYTALAYDPASNLVRKQVFGHPAGQPTASLVELEDRRLANDELGRAFRSDTRLFLSSGFTTTRSPILSDGNSDNFVTSFVDYDAIGRITFLTEDDGEVTAHVYDGANRRISVQDAIGNTSTFVFDRNDNVRSATTVEISPESLVPPETFTTRYVFDQFNRLVRATDNAGQTTYFAFDSRDNLIRVEDPEGAPTADPLGLFPGQINGPGNKKTYLYDGLNRKIAQVCDLRVGGTGAGPLDASNPFNADGQVRLDYAFDGNSRLTAITDDNGNRTRFLYDSLDRRVAHVYANDDAENGGRRERFDYAYDRDDNLLSVTDPNGTVATQTFDGLNRRTQVSVVRGAGVLGTTLETYEYDGLSRLTRATDNNGDPAQTQVCEFVYDSLSRLLEERQNGQAVSNAYSGDGRRTRCVYPGGRTIQTTFDAIDRPKTIVDGTTTPTEIANYDWIGPGARELRRTNANGTVVSFLNAAGTADEGYDAVRRVTRLRVLGPSGTLIDREYDYNRASMRTLERRHDDAGLTDTFDYDSLYRLVSTQYDTDGVGPVVRRSTTSLTYQLDGVGNRRNVTLGSSSGPDTTETYSVNSVNQYLAKGGVSRTHSRNGNLRDDGSRSVAYDYKNRPVSLTTSGSSTPVAEYLYYPDGRRSTKRIYDGAGQLQSETRFFYDGEQVCEEQTAAGATLLTYVYAAGYVDEVIQILRSAAHPLGAGSLYLHQNARADVVAVTDQSGAVLERRLYDDFGRAYDDAKVRITGSLSSVGNPYGFQGRRFDAETGLYYFRQRYYDPDTGRFVQRDPVWDGANVGNQYAFAANSPISHGDSQGTIVGGIKKAKKLYETIQTLREQRRRLATVRKAAKNNKEGGAYGWLPGGADRHHIAEDSVTGIPHRYGPAVRMEKAHHINTRSYGVSGSPPLPKTVAAHRKAMEADIRELKRDHPGLYDQGIKEARAYFRLLEKNELLPGQKYDLGTKKELQALKKKLIAEGVKPAAQLLLLGMITGLGTGAAAQDGREAGSSRRRPCPKVYPTNVTVIQEGERLDPSITLGDLFGAAVDSFAPTVKEMWNNPTAGGADYISAAAWDFAKTIDPAVVTDGIEAGSGYTPGEE